MPLIDVGHFLLEVEIDTEIDPKGNPISSDSNNLDSLQKHHVCNNDNTMVTIFKKGGVSFFLLFFLIFISIIISRP